MTINMDEIEKENEHLNAVWDKAIYNAHKAFNDTFEEQGYDAAYWTIKIISHSVSSDFKSFLETKTWDEYGNYGKEERED